MGGRWRACLCALLVPAVAGCGADEHVAPVDQGGDPPYVPSPPHCDPVDLAAIETFAPCNRGSGIFGEWIVDARGGVAYAYGIDQATLPPELFPNTEDLERRDHWAPFGNHRVNALFYNDGAVEIVTQDRGVEYLNKRGAGDRGFSGGFGYVDDGLWRWSTAHGLRPQGATTERRFGMGYAFAATTFRELRVERTLHAPDGDDPYVIADVVVKNLSDTAKSIHHYEYWDVGRRPIEINWLVSGDLIESAPKDATVLRDGRNSLFDERIVYDADSRALIAERSHAAGASVPDPDEPSALDAYPGQPFLATLVGDVDRAFIDDAVFFGDAGPDAPAALDRGDEGLALVDGPLGSRESALGQPHAFVLRSPLELGPGESAQLRFAYGYAPWDQEPAIRKPHREANRDLVQEMFDALKPRLFYFGADRDPSLHRELAWHAYQVEASVGHRDYFGVRVVPQGSAYLYLHGADGAARDLGIFAMPLVYTHPELAKDELRLYMGVTHAEGHRFSYAFQGHGMLDDALGLHAKPSDLPIFFLWAIGEYLGATGDLAFLDEEIAYWPHDAGVRGTVRHHIQMAVRHLFDTVGTGEHGLIRVQTGDWSDGIVVEAPDRQWAIDHGESVPNTQMAITVLPRIADLLATDDPQLAEEIRSRVAEYEEALPVAWSGDHFGRAFIEPGVLKGAEDLDLEAQVWALIGDTFESGAQRDALLERVHRDLDAPSSIGAGLWKRGDVWPAISGLLTVGYSQHDPLLAWEHFARNTMASHAEAFPDIWYGIWSGPDGVHGEGSSSAGYAWASPVTPMTDFPVMNNNQHTMPMLAALRVAGIRADAEGLSIAPTLPFDYALKTSLIELRKRDHAIAGTFTPLGPRQLTLIAPPGRSFTSVQQDGAFVPVDDPERVTLSADGARPLAFEALTTAR